MNWSIPFPQIDIIPNQLKRWRYMPANNKELASFATKLDIQRLRRYRQQGKVYKFGAMSNNFGEAQKLLLIMCKASFYFQDYANHSIRQ